MVCKPNPSIEEREIANGVFSKVNFIALQYNQGNLTQSWKSIVDIENVGKT